MPIVVKINITVLETKSVAEEKLNLDDGQWEDIHVVTGALKMFFRELSEPLFPYSFFERFVEAIRLTQSYATGILGSQQLWQRVDNHRQEITVHTGLQPTPQNFHNLPPTNCSSECGPITKRTSSLPGPVTFPQHIRYKKETKLL
ncbi:hypothetical protein ACRRTK_024314 [Alexandromys fortis]